MIKRIAPFSSLLILSIGLGFAQATPPDAINYQGSFATLLTSL